MLEGKLRNPALATRTFPDHAYQTPDTTKKRRIDTVHQNSLSSFGVSADLITQRLSKALPLERLLNPDADDHHINMDMFNIDPWLSLMDDELSALAQRIRSQYWSLYKLPTVQQSATTWPSTSLDIDYRWDKVVNDT